MKKRPIFEKRGLAGPYPKEYIRALLTKHSLFSLYITRRPWHGRSPLYEKEKKEKKRRKIRKIKRKKERKEKNNVRHSFRKKIQKRIKICKKKWMYGANESFEKLRSLFRRVFQFFFFYRTATVNNPRPTPIRLRQGPRNRGLFFLNYDSERYQASVLRTKPFDTAVNPYNYYYYYYYHYH